jgi:protease-4
MEEYMDEESNQENRSRRSPLGLLLLLLLIVVVPLVVGFIFAPRLIPEPKIGLVRLNFDIDSLTAFEITEQLAFARENPAIKSVVLIINSPGGSAAYSEELFMDVLNTRSDIPVVASVDLLAASGAYYMAAAADEIYAKPTSNVGSIGVIGLLPGPVFIEEDLLTTGPYKSFGGTRDGMARQIEMAKFAFLDAISAGRGDRLNIDPEVLSRAEIFTGVQAQENGLVDELGSTDEAIQRAAELAGLRSYEIVELFPLAFPELVGDVDFQAYQPSLVDPGSLWAAPTNLPAGIYYRYIQLPAGP